MPYRFAKRSLTIAASTASVFFALFLMCFMGVSSQTQNANAAQGACYKYINSSTIQYISPNCDASAAVSTYTSSDGGTTFTGPKIQSRSRSGAKDCSPGTNYITLKSGTAELTQQKTGSNNGATTCEDGSNTTTIELVNWSGTTGADDARVNATYAAFGGSLDELKGKYYQSLGSKAPCSSQGCNDSAWKQTVYTCWNKARSDAATTARWSAQAGQQIDTALLTKDNFSTCLAKEMDGSGITAAGVKSYVSNIDVAAINGAGEKAAAEYTQQNTKTPETPETNTGSSCGIEGIGWVVCPVLSFLGNVTDTVFNVLATNFLETSASILKDPGIQNAWSAMRTLANVAFVIAFLVIIYSQLTSAGVSNYGVKKMLPRLIVAAILVNLSYIICQLAVDLSNLLGYSLKTLFDGGVFKINADVSGSGDATGNGFGIAVIITALLAGGVTLAMTISMPVVLAAALALILIALILFARTALIILLTVVSPLAFVAYLLPNTEQWFKKWYKMFFALLMVFPIIGVLFGASSLAAKVINTAAVADNNQMMQVVAIGVATMPLFLVPSLLKNSLSAVGSLGSKVAGWSSKANGRVGARVKDSSQLGRRMQEYKTGRERSRAAKAIRSRNSLIGRGVDSVIGRVPGASKFLGTERGSVLAAKAEDDLFDEEVGLQKTLLKNEGGASEWLGVMNDKSQSAEKRAAAAALVAAHGGRKDQLAAIHASTKILSDPNASASDKQAAKAMQKQMLANFGNRTPFALGDSERAAMMEGKYAGNIYQRLAERAQTNLTPEQLAHMDIDELQELANISSGEDSAATRAINESITDPSKQAELRNGVTNSMSEKISAVEGDDILKNSVAPRDRVQYDRIRGSSSSSASTELKVEHTSGGSPPVTSASAAPPKPTAKPEDKGIPGHSDFMDSLK